MSRLLWAGDRIGRGDGEAPRQKRRGHAAALDELSCPHLGEQGYRTYAERLLICRLFGTAPRLACPNGKHPGITIDPRIEQRIYRYFAETRHVLV
ncbi:MAG TPA: hypothetical protein VMV78_04885 [Thiobacillus sp.]|jgi:hypothetical protein|nr:hypothetical protein [Thiobacillus sp.]